MSMRQVQLMTGLPFKVNPYQDITDTLPSRTPDPEKTRTPEQITHISVHHSGVEGGTIKGYADYHVNTQGWAHIGYHLVIKGDQTYQTNDLLTFSYHTSSNNHYTIGISVSADLSKRPMSEVERNNLYAAILTVMGLFNIPVENVLGHNEFPANKTSCPCIDMNNLRSDIKTIQMKIEQSNSWDSKLVKVNEIAKQFNFMNSLIKAGESDGNAQWAMNQQLVLYDTMKKQGLL